MVTKNSYLRYIDKSIYNLSLRSFLFYFEGYVTFLQHEYMRGISAWNFDLEDLRKQASLVSKVVVSRVYF